MIGLGIYSTLEVERGIFFIVDGKMSYICRYLRMGFSREIYVDTATTTAIFTGWLGLALILGLIYWENGERWKRYEERVMDGMGWKD